MDAVKFSVGSGKNNPKTQVIEVEATPEAVAAALNNLDGKEVWFSTFVFSDNHRRAKSSAQTQFICQDIDCELDGVKIVPNDEWRTIMLDHATKQGANIYYPTPHGCRVGYLFTDVLTEQPRMRAVANFIASMYESLPVPMKVDAACRTDIARLYWAPHSTIDGKRREFDAIALPNPVRSSSEYMPLAKVVGEIKSKRKQSFRTDTLIEIYVREHPRTYPVKGTGTCPMCKHNGCFGVYDDDPTYWACWSSEHDKGGVKRDNYWFGRAHDIDAFEAGYSDPVLFVKSQTLNQPRDTPIHASTIEALDWMLRDEETRRTLGLSGPLRYNLLKQIEQIGDNPFTPTTHDDLVYDIRVNAANKLPPDINGRQLKFHKQDVSDAITRVAHASSFHPVRDYLNSLEWDGFNRLDSMLQDIFGIEKPTALEVSMLRCWMIAAVARMLRDQETQVDFMLVLIGKEGTWKSTFFATIVPDPTWFTDSPSDIDGRNKDDDEKHEKHWIIEFSENAALRRAKSAEAVRAFISRKNNTYRNAYGRTTLTRVRHYVFGATSNPDEILSDENNRRFFIIRTPNAIDIDFLKDTRDQLWAEAVAAFKAGEQWWLDSSLVPSQREHNEEFRIVDDALTIKVNDWLGRTVKNVFNMLELMEGIGVGEVQHQTQALAMKIAPILKKAGYQRETKWLDGKMRKVWRKQG